MTTELKATAKGWKCFDENLKCKGFQFEVGKIYEHDGEVEMCKSGFHFHENPSDLFTYYNKDSRVCEVEANDVISGDNKSVCRSIKILKELFGISKMLIGGYGYGYGDGYGNGNGDGYGYGDGNGNGNGYGYGDGNGNGYGYGYGDGNGDGYGDGYGYGYGDGDGDGYGDGNGDGDGDGDLLIFQRSFRKCS